MQEEVLEEVSEELPPPEPLQTRIVQNERERADAELLDLINGFGADKGYQLKIARTQPKKVRGVAVDGHLDTFEEWQTEDQIREQFGGGTYQLKVMRPDGRGSMKYFKSVTVKISGEPRGQGIPKKEEEEAPRRAVDPSESQALSMVEKLVEDARKSSRESSGGGIDMPAMMAMMNSFMAPIQAQLEASQKQLAEANRAAAEKETRILELINQKPDTSEKDNLLNKMFDTESSRTENLRAMHESEMRQLRENAKEDVRRMEDRHREELRARAEIQSREIDNITRSNAATVDTLKMSYESRIDSLKSDVARVERDLTEARTELAALRAKKDKTIIEQASEFSAIKEALSVISGDSDKEESKWYEKLASAVTENPEAVGMAIQSFTGAGGGAAAPMPNPPEQQQLAPPQGSQETQEAQQQVVHSIDDIEIGQPFRGEDGQVYVKIPPDGSVVTLAQAQEIARREQLAREEATPGVKKPSPMEVKMAINFMESAFTAGTSSKDFAASAKSMIPQDILKYIEAVGIDTFLNEVAVLEQGSPLRNQAGREYIREVAKFLLEGIPS